MPPRRRLDAELVRRGLARSREQAAALIADGRVRVAGPGASKPATGVEPAEPIVVAEHCGRRRLRLARRAQAGRRPRRLRPPRSARRRPALPGRRGVHRRLHRRAAPPRGRPGGRGRRRVRPAGVVAAHRPAGRRPGPHQRPRALTRRGRASRSTLVVADLSFISLRLVLSAACRRARRRDGDLRADGEAAVRGGPGARRPGRGRPRSGAAGRGRTLGRGGSRRARPRRGRRHGQPAARPVGQRRVLPLAAGRCTAARSGRRRPRRPGGTSSDRRDVLCCWWRTPAARRRATRRQELSTSTQGGHRGTGARAPRPASSTLPDAVVVVEPGPDAARGMRAGRRPRRRRHDPARRRDRPPGGDSGARVSTSGTSASSPRPSATTSATPSSAWSRADYEVEERMTIDVIVRLGRRQHRRTDGRSTRQASRRPAASG